MMTLGGSHHPVTLRHGLPQRTIGEIKLGKAKQVKKKKKQK